MYDDWTTDELINRIRDLEDIDKGNQLMLQRFC